MSAGAPQATNAGSLDAFVCGLSADGTALIFSTYLGGSSSDSGNAIAVNPTASAVWIAGTTSSWNFPVTSGAYQRTFGGIFDTFAARIDVGSRTTRYVTYLGGSDRDVANGMALDSSESVWIVGGTNSTNFPTASGVQSTLSTPGDGFAAVLDANGWLLFSTYLGGHGDDRANAVAGNGSGAAILAGGTWSRDFPYSTYAHQLLTSSSTAFVAGLSGVSLSSPVPIFQVDGVTPASGSGSDQVFAISVTDPQGASDIFSIWLLISPNAIGAGNCYLEYSQTNNYLRIANDAATLFTVPVVPGSFGTSGNSQCAVAASTSTMTASGNTLVVRASLAFKAPYSGTKNVYAMAQNKAGAYTGMKPFGTFDVTLSQNRAPTVVSLSPTSGSGASQVFTLTYSDADGAADIAAGYLLFSTTGSGANSCYAEYNKQVNIIRVSNDAGNGFGLPVTPGGSGVASNSQCSISASGSSVTTAGSTIQVRLAITFKPGFTGSKNVWAFVYDLSGLNSGFQVLGAFNPTPDQRWRPAKVSIELSTGSAIGGSLNKSNDYRPPSITVLPGQARLRHGCRPPRLRLRTILLPRRHQLCRQPASPGISILAADTSTVPTGNSAAAGPLFARDGDTRTRPPRSCDHYSRRRWSAPSRNSPGPIDCLP